MYTYVCNRSRCWALDTSISSCGRTLRFPDNPYRSCRSLFRCIWSSDLGPVLFLRDIHNCMFQARSCIPHQPRKHPTLNIHHCLCIGLPDFLRNLEDIGIRNYPVSWYIWRFHRTSRWVRWICHIRRYLYREKKKCKLWVTRLRWMFEHTSMIENHRLQTNCVHQNKNRMAIKFRTTRINCIKIKGKCNYD